MKNITAREFKKIWQSNADINILDVRENWEFEEAHIKGALNFSLYSIPKNAEELKKLKNQTIYLHCKSGNRSQKAQVLLTQQGFSNVINIIGGFDAWKEIK